MVIETNAIDVAKTWRHVVTYIKLIMAHDAQQGGMSPATEKTYMFPVFFEVALSVDRNFLR